MGNYIRYKDSIDIIKGSAATDMISTASHPCIGHNVARFVAIGAGIVDSGGINATVYIQGSIDGKNWDAALGTVTFSSSDQVLYSSAIDVRGYSHLRAVYNKNGATAGTVSVRLISHI